MYQIKKQYQNYQMLITHIDGRVVNLTGVDVKKIILPTANAIGKEVLIPGATQKDLKAAFESGNECIEKVEVNQVPENTVPAPVTEPVSKKSKKDSE